MDHNHSGDADTLLLIIIAIFISPLAVYLHEGSWNTTCWINLILWLLFILPGFIHALIVILG
ncbi:MAG: YqaE/Pmp3 family membrane protein [Flavobacteriales bacterium]|nr:YqaE/Pmp3 family membrane protein [Flavobacteriales bacterium]